VSLYPWAKLYNAYSFKIDTKNIGNLLDIDQARESVKGTGHLYIDKIEELKKGFETIQNYGRLGKS